MAILLVTFILIRCRFGPGLGAGGAAGGAAVAVVGDGGLTGSLGGKFEVKLEGGDGKCGLGFGLWVPLGTYAQGAGNSHAGGAGKMA